MELDSMVFIPGDRATFRCSESPVLPGVQWLVNGTALENLNLSNVTSEFSNEFRSGFLTFHYVPLEYNMTTISCRANTTSEMMVSTNVWLMLIQGIYYIAPMNVRN